MNYRLFMLAGTFLVHAALCAEPHKPTTLPPSAPPAHALKKEDKSGIDRARELMEGNAVEVYSALQENWQGRRNKVLGPVMALSSMNKNVIKFLTSRKRSAGAQRFLDAILAISTQPPVTCHTRAAQFSYQHAIAFRSMCAESQYPEMMPRIASTADNNNRCALRALSSLSPAERQLVWDLLKVSYRATKNKADTAIDYEEESYEIV